MKSITVKYGVNSVTRQVDTNYTFGELANDDSFKGALGHGDNVKCLVEGIEQDKSTVIPAGATVRLETAANTKA